MDSSAFLKSVREKLLAPREFTIPAGATGEPLKVSVRLLSERELDGCRLAAIQYAKDLRVDTIVDGDEIIERETRRQIIALATTWPASRGTESPRVFPVDRDVRELDSVSIDRFFAAYREAQDRAAEFYSLKPEDRDRLVDVIVAAGGDAMGLGLIADRALREVVLALAARLRGDATTAATSPVEPVQAPPPVELDPIVVEGAEEAAVWAQAWSAALIVERSGNPRAQPPARVAARAVIDFRDAKRATATP